MTPTQEKFAKLRAEMHAALIERDEEIDMVLIAVACNEHALLVGAPGSAKSMLVDSLSKAVNGSTKSFHYLLTKFTTPEELFGPISLTDLKKNKYRRITTDKLPEADFAFLDEAFKASSAILNTTLQILNERKYDDGEGLKSVPLVFCAGASNEWPDPHEGGKELGALLDRFLFRKEVRRVSGRGREKLLFGDLPGVTHGILNRDDLHTAAKESAAVKINKQVTQTILDIDDALGEEGISPGDRRRRKAVNAVKARAWLEGREAAEKIDCDVLENVLWDAPEQQAKCAEVVNKIANPDKAKVLELLASAHEAGKSNMTDTLARTKAFKVLREIKESLEGLGTTKRRDDALSFVKSEMLRVQDTFLA